VRERRRFDVRHTLVDDEGGIATLYDYPFLPLEHRRDARILITNWGRQDPTTGRGEHFWICVECGRHRPPDDERRKRWDEDHARICPGQCEDLVLGYEFRTDVLVVSVAPEPGGQAYDEPLLVSTAEALLIAATAYLETEPGEIAAFPRRMGENRPGQVVLYETVPGGAGYLEELAKHLPAAAGAAYRRLFGHDCFKACYRCLKHFGNQRWHGALNKELVRSTLFHLMCADSVAPRTVGAGAATGVLRDQLDARLEERQSSVYPKGHIEEVLLDALRGLGDVPEPIRDFEVRAPDGRLVTVPDFAWPDVQLAVYCDGYQYHGEREALELDAAKRNYLQREGWTVLQYWGRMILKSPSQCALEIAQTFRSRKSGGSHTDV
jgi:hypothetical protein